MSRIIIVVIILVKGVLILVLDLIVVWENDLVVGYVFRKGFSRFVILIVISF